MSGTSTCYDTTMTHLMKFPLTEDGYRVPQTADSRNKICYPAFSVCRQSQCHWLDARPGDALFIYNEKMARSWNAVWRVESRDEEKNCIPTEQIRQQQAKQQRIHELTVKGIYNYMSLVEMMHTFMHRLPGLKICWIFPGTNIVLNFEGRSVARCGTWRSPIANTRTIFVSPPDVICVL